MGNRTRITSSPTHWTRGWPKRVAEPKKAREIEREMKEEEKGEERKGDGEQMVYPAARRRGGHDGCVLGVCRVIWVCNLKCNGIVFIFV